MLFIIENPLSNDITPLYQTLERHKIQYKTEKEIKETELNQPIVFYGSINAAKSLNKNAIPGIFNNFPDFRFTNYASKIGELLTNEFYAIYPIGDLKRIIGEYFSDTQKQIFIKPNRGDKPFTGQLINSLNYEQTIQNIQATSRLDSDELIICAGHKKIIAEYRLLCVKNKIIAQSQYEPTINKDVPSEIIDFATTAVKLLHNRMFNLRTYTIDIALEESGRISLLEINSFSCAGMYAMDWNLIVPAIVELAKEEWDEYN